MASKSFLWLARKVHLYFGLLISPALLFFAFTGAFQTLGLHESGGTTYKPPAWMATFAQIHKKQTWRMPTRPDGGRPARPAAGDDHQGPVSRSPASGDGRSGDAASAHSRPGGGPSDAGTAGGPAKAPVTLASKQKQHLPLKIFFVLVSLGLFVSTLTGIYMAYAFDRNRKLVTALLVLGVVLPVLLLQF